MTGEFFWNGDGETFEGNGECEGNGDGFEETGEPFDTSKKAGIPLGDTGLRTRGGG